MTLDLEAMRRRCEAATPGPWKSEGESLYYVETDDETLGLYEDVQFARLNYYAELQETLATGDFIAHARTDLPALLAWVERARAKLIEAFGGPCDEFEADCVVCQIWQLLAELTQQASPGEG